MRGALERGETESGSRNRHRTRVFHVKQKTAQTKNDDKKRDI